MLQDGNQPLHWALRKGHDAIARLLLEKGAPVDAVDLVGAWECEHGACLGERRGACGSSQWFAAKGPLEAGADTAMLLCCSMEISHCTMPVREDILRLQGCCWRRVHQWVQ